MFGDDAWKWAARLLSVGAVLALIGAVSALWMFGKVVYWLLVGA